MPLYRGFAIALCLVVAAAVAAVAIPRTPPIRLPSAVAGTPVASPTLARRNLPAAMAALGRLAVPGDFHRLQSGCRWYRCYVVPEPTTKVAPSLTSLMRSAGALNPQTERLQTAARSLIAPLQHVTKQAISTQLAGCDTSVRGIVTCAYPTVIDHNVVVFFLGPYLPDRAGHHRWSGETDVEVSLPSGSAAYP